MVFLNTQFSRPKNTYPIYIFVDLVLKRILRILPASKWTEHIALWWGYRFMPVAGLVRLRSGAQLYLNPSDYLQIILYYLGTFEDYCLPYLRGCVKKSGTVVDVGANIGFYTLESALAVGSNGHVISIEAAPPHVKTVRHNLVLNGIENVVIVEVAVGETNGEGNLALPVQGNLGMYTLGKTLGSESFTVNVRPLDDVLGELNVESIDLIKMDIEGSEFHALSGATVTLRKHRPAILIELNEGALTNCHSSSQQVKELLRNNGYLGWVINRSGAWPIDHDQPRHECDECLFLHCGDTETMCKLRLPKAI